MVDLVERRAVIADGHPLWLSALGELLAAAGITVVGRATTTTAALALVQEQEPDVLVVGLELEADGIDVWECVREARAARAELKTVVVSSQADRRDVETAFAEGASAFCVKSAQPDDMAAAIRQSFEHSIYLAHGVSTAPPQRPSAPEPLLTRREVEILKLVAEGHSNSQLARMLWVTEQTVKFHLSNIYRKLDVSNRTEASRWAQRNGLLAPDPDVRTNVA